MRRATTAFLLVVALAVAGRASAQPAGQSDAAKPATQTQATPANDAATAQNTRPATTTFFGDTGLWFVPTACSMLRRLMLSTGRISAGSTLRGAR